MAATYFDMEEFPRHVIAGFFHVISVTARNADGSVDTGYTGTVSFSASDPEANLPPAYTYVGGDAGTHRFQVRFANNGAQLLVVMDGSATPATGRTTVVVRPPGWGFDDEGILPYGDAVAGIGAHLKRASAVSTREVDVEVSNLVQDNGAFLPGDALNPETWHLQRLDNAAFLNVVSVVQISTYVYRLTTLEEFGPVAVTHRVSSDTLLDVSGNVIVSPRQADFLGLTQALVPAMTVKKASRDYANLPVPEDLRGFFAGTLQLDGAGDYKLEEGAPLVKKLIIRRLLSSPGDFFHIPQYGLGLRQKSAIPESQLGKLKKAIEDAAKMEPEVDSAVASLMMDPAHGVLTVMLRAKLLKTGETLGIGFRSDASGIVFL